MKSIQCCFFLNVRRFIPSGVFLILSALTLLSCKSENITQPAPVSTEIYSFEVIDFYKTVEQYSQFFDIKSGFTKTFSKEELRDFARKYYLAKANDPIGYETYGYKLYQAWMDELKANGMKPTRVEPGTVTVLLLKQIGKLYSPQFSRMIDVPFFVCGKIIAKEDTISTDTTLHITLRQTNLFIQVDEVIKGNKFFKVNDTLKIIYMDLWYSYVLNPAAYFTVGKRFFFPLWYRLFADDSTYLLAMYYLEEESPGGYPIENGRILIPEDYFGLGKDLSWPEFKEYVKTNFILD
ncbi:MAG: hypothetical protein ACM3UR_14685 [Bacteroidota bacterium]|jgi:hypothetical protein|nr:hypothetical protein [Ignavibacteria bacterium]MCU7500404.1 hypothetical protein [Ignavibacteria bacterium]MCU7514701.1 hypothetical protein [Ignavibacteria bacterium]MCU7518551.1 hypothetical protein [Ignavibacteria bacterium]MCU7526667.1 hypothetical protein [Ignavibacteria bacterium]